MRLTPSLCAFPATAILWTFACSTVCATEYAIRPDGLGDFATIQAGVDSAAPGDTLTLEDGVFTGTGNRDVSFAGKDLVVRSRNGAQFTTIDSQGVTGSPHRAFRLVSGETQASRIDGLTITGGFVEGVFPESGGGGILIAYNTHPVITNCIFDGNEAGFQGFGAGLLAYDGCNIRLTDCTFQNGESGWYGGGFTLRLDSDAVVERVLVINNHAIHAGGGASITNSDAIVNDCVFAFNSVDEADGGGLLVKAGALPVLTRCVFRGNQALRGAGLGLGNDPIVTAVSCLFEGNTASDGGAVCLDQCPSTISFTSCTFAGNDAAYSGDHIFNGPNATCTIRTSILDDSCPGPAIQTDITAVLDVDCSILVGGPAAISGFGPVIYGAGNVDADPLFCAPAACALPGTPGDYSLEALSPAAPGWNSCGLVGAYPVACGPTAAPPSLEVRSWGEVKSAYRAPR